MANTMKLISEVTVGSGGTANINFASIPSTYTDLLLIGSCRTDGTYTDEDLLIKFNNSTSNYARRRLGGTGSAAFMDYYAANTPGRVNGNTSTAGTFNNFSIYIPNYTASEPKIASYDTVTENSATASIQQIVAVTWNDTTAINQITLYETTRNLVQYSTAYLYGISKS